MDISDGVIHIIVPGWVWLLIIAAIMLVVAVRMVMKTGVDNILSREEWTTRTLCRAVFFTWMVGGAAVCIVATIARFASS